MVRDLGVRPVYLPKVPPRGNAAKAAAWIADCVHIQLQSTPEAPTFIF